LSDLSGLWVTGGSCTGSQALPRGGARAPAEVGLVRPPGGGSPPGDPGAPHGPSSAGVSYQTMRSPRPPR